MAELTSDQSPVFHCGQRNSLQGWLVSLSLWLHLLSSPSASAAFRHTAPLRRVPPPQLFEHCSTKAWVSVSVSMQSVTQSLLCSHVKFAPSYLWPGWVLPATRVTVSVATFLVIGFVLTTAEAIVDLLRLTVCVADFGAVDFQGAISQTTLCCTLTLASHVPPGPRAQIGYKEKKKKMARLDSKLVTQTWVHIQCCRDPRWQEVGGFHGTSGPTPPLCQTLCYTQSSACGLLTPHNNNLPV